MLTFPWKYKKLKQIKGSWNAWDIFTGLDPRLLHVTKWCPHQRNHSLILRRSSSFVTLLWRECVNKATNDLDCLRIRLKKSRQTLLSTFFKGQHELKTLNARKQHLPVMCRQQAWMTKTLTLKPSSQLIQRHPLVKKHPIAWRATW